MNRGEKAKLADGLGATRVVEVVRKKISGPLDMLALREEVNRRLRSSGGRPTDPAWKVTRQVPFKEESWTRLQDIAVEVGASGRRVGPAQVAALLVERSLEELDDAKWRDTLEMSRRVALMSEPDAAEAARVTYSQFDDWVQQGWVIPAARRGRRVFFSADEIVRAVWFAAIATSSAEPTDLVADIRARDLSERYLVFTNMTTIRTAPTRTALYRLFEAPGSHLVIDQLPERRKLLGFPPFPDHHEDPEVEQAV
jgi:hypothetical protein